VVSRGRQAHNTCCRNSDGSARGGSWRRVQTARRRGRRQRYVALVIWSVEKLITCAITWCVERLMTCGVAWCMERLMTCGVKTETGVRGQKAGAGVRRGGERREKYAQSPQVSYRGLPPPPPFRFAARARKLSRARARESGDTTPCRMTCVTLHRHVRYKKIKARTCRQSNLSRARARNPTRVWRYVRIGVTLHV